MPKTKLKPPMTPPDLDAYYKDPEILAPPSWKALAGNTWEDMRILPNEEFDGDGCA